MSTQRQALGPRYTGETFGPKLPTDSQCKLKVDRSCKSICDCTLAILGCQTIGVSVHQPRGGWAPQEVKTIQEGKCAQKISGCMPSGIHADVALACSNGVCTTTGPQTNSSSHASDEIAVAQPALVHAQQLVCDPAAADDWAAALYRRLLAGRATGQTGAELYDATCRASFKRECTDVCDCKFVLADCKVAAASLSEPGHYWAPKRPVDSGTDCKKGISCGYREHRPGICAPKLACTNGKCTATDASPGGDCTAGTAD